LSDKNHHWSVNVPTLPKSLLTYPQSSSPRWSPLEQAWVTGGVEVQRPVYWDDVEVACVVYAVPDGNGTAFTAFFVPVEISTTTTTVGGKQPGEG